jgi:hypothetical protein
MRLADSKEAEIRREVSRAFALFASKRDSHAALVRSHAAARIMTFLSDTDEVAQRYGVLGIGNMAISKESHQELFDVGAVAGLLNCAKSNDLQTRRCCAFAFNNIAANAANHPAAEVINTLRYA